MEEVWMKIAGCDRDYFISNFGFFKEEGAFHETYNNKIRKGSKDKSGYLRVSLLINGKYVTKKIHRLVAEYFLDDYSEELTVNHIDFNKENNNVSNLEMMTASNNTYNYIFKKKDKSSSGYMGVGYHKGIKKWTARVVLDGNRHSVGTYLTEKEAIQACEDFKNGNGVVRIGKGCSLIGRSKYSDDFKRKAVELSLEIGLEKAGVETKAGTTQISKWRREFGVGYRRVNLKKSE